GRETRSSQDLVDLATQVRNGPSLPAIGLGGVQADQAAFAPDRPPLIELLDADVDEMFGAVHRRAGIGARQHQHHRRSDVVPNTGREVSPWTEATLAHLLAQDAEARTLHRHLDVLAAIADQLVVARPHEGDVAIGEPTQPLDRGALLGRYDGGNGRG